LGLDQTRSKSWRVKAALTLLFGLALTVVFDCLFLNFLIQPWAKKALILVISVPLIMLAVYWVVFKLLVLGQGFSGKTWGAFWLVVMAAAAVLWPVYRDALPAIPARHTLEITVLCDQATPATGNEVQILWISRLALPTKVETPVTSSEVEPAGSWQVGNGGWYTDCKQPSSLRFSEFIQGGVILGFQDLPSLPLVRVTWDGKPQRLDFYSPEDQVQAVRLVTNTPGENITTNWRILIGILWAAEYITLTGLVFLVAFLSFSTVTRPRQVKDFTLETMGSIYSLRRLVEPIVNRRTVLALALPVMLLVGIVINLLVIGQNIRFNWLEGNDMLAFARESVGKEGNSIVYFYLLNHYFGRTLLVNPTMLDQTRLLPEELVGLSRIGQLEKQPYRVMLTPAEAAALRALPNYQIPARGYLKLSFRFYDAPDNGEPLCMQRIGAEVFVGPVSLLSGCREAQ
jgi:hypothetical protein